MAQAPSASVFTLDSRKKAAQAFLMGYADTNLATVLTTARGNGFPSIGVANTQLVNFDIGSEIIGSNNT